MGKKRLELSKSQTADLVVRLAAQLVQIQGLMPAKQRVD
jgi:hypothetical protein